MSTCGKRRGESIRPVAFPQSIKLHPICHLSLHNIRDVLLETLLVEILTREAMATTEIPSTSGFVVPGSSGDIKEPRVLEANVIDSDEEPKQTSDVLSDDSDSAKSNSVSEASMPESLATDITPGSVPLEAPSDENNVDVPAETKIASSVPTKRYFVPDAEDGFSSASDISLPPTPAIQTSTSLEAEKELTLTERPFLALQILDILSRYGQNALDQSEWAGRTKFLPLVEQYIEKNEPVKMVLPAFPCKSINKTDKVLGLLPDFGEELALSHLNGLCESIADVYEHGAEVVITSDGLVYNGTGGRTMYKHVANHQQIFWASPMLMYGIIPRRSARSFRLESYASSKRFVSLISSDMRERET